MVELAPFHILVLRGISLIVEAYNPHFSRILEGRAVLGQPLDEVFEMFWDHENAVPLLKFAREVYQQDQVHITQRMLSRFSTRGDEVQERYFSYTLIPSHDVKAKVNGVIIYGTDETIQQTQETAEEQERLKLIFDNTSSAVLALYNAHTGQLLIASPSYINIIRGGENNTMRDFIGHSWQELTYITPPEQAAQIWQRTLKSHTAQHISEVHIPASATRAETIWNYVLSPIFDHEQRDTVRYMLISAVEVTEQVQIRQELERLDNLQDDFLSLATHELRTPLTSIMGNAQLLQKKLKRREQEDEQETLLTERIVQQVKRLEGLISEMLDVTRMRGDMFDLHYEENVDVVALIRRIVEQQAQNDHRIMMTTTELSISGTIDVGHVEQILNNLLSNAAKYSLDGKPIQVTVKRAEHNAQEVIIAVRDEGYGISEEEQTHIFDRFYRVRATDHKRVDGLGLGLYIAYEIVNQLGGRMWVESKPNNGSTFFFSLPLEKIVKETNDHRHE